MYLNLRKCWISLLAVCAFPAYPQWDAHTPRDAPRTPEGDVNLIAPAPRGADGKPDLSGVWDCCVNMPQAPPGVAIESSQGPDFSLQFWREKAAPIPMTPWGEALFKEHDRSFGAGRPSGRCLPHGIPDAMMSSPFKILQQPGLTGILYEAFMHFRQIFTDGRSLPADPNPAWFGYSTGRWEGDTFVVDTIGFNDRSWLDDAGHPHSEGLHTIERFRRPDYGDLEVEVTIDDPKAYTEPWRVTLHFGLLWDTELIEDVCENEKDAVHIVGNR